MHAARRFFAEASVRLACMVIGSRPQPGSLGCPAQELWITDGLYGSFNCLLWAPCYLSVRLAACTQPHVQVAQRTKRTLSHHQPQGI